MSGHSKWKTIKHKKALTDAKKSKHFSKLIREIEVCARVGGGDPASNATLRTLLDKARDINMPLDNAMRAIKKGTGELAGENYEAFTYEGYGPNNIALLIETLSSNKNRTVSEIRHIFNYKGGTLAAGGAVSWMFERKGVITIENETLTEESLLDLLMDYPIDNITKHDDIITITTDPKALEEVKNKLKESHVTIQEAQVEWLAKDTMDLPENQAQTTLDFIETLEDLDDVQNVYSNLA